MSINTLYEEVGEPLNLPNLQQRVTRSTAASKRGNDPIQTKGVTKDQVIECSECGKNFSSKDHLQTHVRQVHRGEKPFTCGICYKSFPQRTSLRIHLNIHSGEKPYKCKFCDKSFGGKSNLNRHIRIHTLEKPYSCTYCDKNFSDPGNLKVHVNHHTQTKNFKCNECGKAFYQHNQLKQHLKTHCENIQSQAFVCDICGQSYGKEGYLRRHLKAHHAYEDTSHTLDTNDRHTFALETGNTSMLNTNTADNSAIQPATTLEEPVNLPSVYATGQGLLPPISEPGILGWSKHSVGQSQGAENDGSVENLNVQVGKNSNADNVTKLKPTKQAKRVKCTKCGKILASRASLTMHLRIHIGEKRYACSSCDKRFHQRTSLIVHQLIHKGEKPHACTSCSKAFASRANLVRHLRIHTKEKPYSCPHCKKQFGESGNLKVHLRFHTNTKPFKCEFCGKTFYQYAHMKQHLKTHNKDKVFSCKECDRKFSRVGYLERHMRGHTKDKKKKLHKCHICWKQLSRSTHLRRHMRVHEKENRDGKEASSQEEKAKRVKKTEVVSLAVNKDKGVSETTNNVSEDEIGVDESPILLPGRKNTQLQTVATQNDVTAANIAPAASLHSQVVQRIPNTPNLNASFQDPYQLHAHASLFNSMQAPNSMPQTSALHTYPELLPPRNVQPLPPQHSIQSLTPQRMLSCETCGLQFSRPLHLKKHRKTHSNNSSTDIQTFHPMAATGYGQELNSYSQFNHMPNLQQTYRCDVCNANTTDISDLWAHFHIHSGQMRLLEAKLNSHPI